MITEGELYFFNQIKDGCEVIFDVGAQMDTYLIDMAPDKEYHLFEPNMNFCTEIFNKLKNYSKNDKVFINPFGLGNRTETKLYYPDSQSFFIRTHHFQTNPSGGILLDIKDFMEYIKENNIKKIDFLKIDTEGGEPDILIPYSMWIRDNVKYIQFEYASTWYDRPGFQWKLENIYNLYQSKFHLYFLYNDAHPFSKDYSAMLTPITNQYTIDSIEQSVYNQYGFEIAMVKK